MRRPIRLNSRPRSLKCSIHVTVITVSVSVYEDHKLKAVAYRRRLRGLEPLNNPRYATTFKVVAQLYNYQILKTKAKYAIHAHLTYQYTVFNIRVTLVLFARSRPNMLGPYITTGFTGIDHISWVV